MSWYLKVLKNYFNFSGRARRKEYWMFILCNIIISLLIALLSSIIGVKLIQKIYALAMIIPSIAVSVRRLHDTGKSGMWILLSFIPVIGSICLVILFCIQGQYGNNKYGYSPKEIFNQ